MISFRDVRWLWLLAGLPLVALFLLARERVRARLARRFVSDSLRQSGDPLRRFRPWLLTAGVLLACVALAGPLRGFATVAMVEREANRVVVLDVSNSMLARELGTARLSVAKAIAHRLIDAWPGRVALVEFEAAAEVVSPLTNDSDAVLALLDSMQAGEVGSPGSDMGSAIQTALRLVEAEPGAVGDIVLISDGEDQGAKLDEALKRARQRGVTISTILVGSGAEAEIPTADGQSMKDDAGNVIRTIAHPETLQKIAAMTGGRFITNATGEHAVDALLTPRTGRAARGHNVRVPVDRYQWPLAAAFLALFLASLTNRGAE